MSNTITDLLGDLTEIIGGPTDDEPTGILDEYELRAVPCGKVDAVIGWFCPKSHDGNEGHIQIIARDLQGNQDGLTVGEIVRSVLEHEGEWH